jgi:hypothetical protein
MNPISLTVETEAIARRVVWFEPPAQALADPVRFMAYALTYATHEDLQILRRYVPETQWPALLDQVPPGIMDPRSWAYWNSRAGRWPPPPMPRRFAERGA